MAPAGRYCVIDLSLNQHLSLWSNTVKRRPTHISKIMKSPNWSLSYLSFEETGLNGWQERGPPQEDLKKKKVSKTIFVWKMLRCHKVILLDEQTQFSCVVFVNHQCSSERERGRETEREWARVELGGWRGGDEWEWWVYWVLSGWVDGGWMSSRAGTKIASNREWRDAQPLRKSFPIS